MNEPECYRWEILLSPLIRIEDLMGFLPQDFYEQTSIAVRRGTTGFLAIEELIYEAIIL